MKMNVGATALLISLMMIDEAFAGFFQFVPNAPPVPEFDGPAGIAAIALLVGLGVIFYNKVRK